MEEAAENSEDLDLFGDEDGTDTFFFDDVAEDNTIHPLVEEDNVTGENPDIDTLNLPLDHVQELLDNSPEEETPEQIESKESPSSSNNMMFVGIGALVVLFVFFMVNQNSTTDTQSKEKVMERAQKTSTAEKNEQKDNQRKAILRVSKPPSFRKENGKHEKTKLTTMDDISVSFQNHRNQAI